MILTLSFRETNVMPHQKLLNLFKDHKIDFDLYTHEPLFTAEDSHKLPLLVKVIQQRSK